MMRLCGITCEREAVNFLFKKVPEPYITSYGNHLAAAQARTKAAHAVVPDLHVTNFPARGSAANQTSLQQSVEAIFEVKTRYGSSLMQFSATDRRARDIQEKEYPGKFKKLDAKFAADRGSGEAGPFSEAQAQFLSGGIIPLVFWSIW